MGLLDSLERGIEKAVRGAFAGRGGSLGPVEIATAVRRHMDRESFTLSEGRTFVPNLYKIRLSQDDFSEAKRYGVALAEELCEEIIRHAESQGYTLLGPVKTTFVKNTELKRGQLSVESQTDKNVQEPSHGQPASAAAVGPTATTAIPRAVAPPAYPASQAQQVAVLEHNGTEHRLNGPTTVLGRSTSADITLPDTGISRRHAEVVRQGSRYIARDLGSTNGTYVNGQLLTGTNNEAVLTEGATISLGNARLRFRQGNHGAY